MAISISFCSTSGISAKDSTALNKFKAATILNMIKYIDLGKNDDMIICIAGNKKITDIVEAFLAKRPNDKIGKVSSFIAPKQDIQSCDFLFMSSDNPSLAMKSLGYANAATHPMVTISDMNDFIKTSGGLVEIFEDNGRIRYSLNLKKAKFDNIKINSKLIESAHKIY